MAVSRDGLEQILNAQYNNIEPRRARHLGNKTEQPDANMAEEDDIHAQAKEGAHVHQGRSNAIYARSAGCLY